MSAEKVPELIPCAHCGAVPNRFRERNEFWRVVCDHCGIRTEAVYPVRVAEEAWNRRTPDLRALIERAVEMARENAYVEYCPDEYAPCHEVRYADTTAEILVKLLGEESR